jgi:hypothetical protein
VVRASNGAAAALNRQFHRHLRLELHQCQLLVHNQHMLIIRKSEAVRLTKRQALTELVNAARESGATTSSDPVDDLYNPTTGLPQ